MSGNNVSLLGQLIEAIISEELPSSASDPLSTSPNKKPNKSRKSLKQQQAEFDAGQMSPEDFETFFQRMTQRRHGKATLSRADMERLDKLTRWMKYIPFMGTSYRKGLAKYLRSTRDDQYVDPFKDFRKYQYASQNEEVQNEGMPVDNQPGVGQENLQEEPSLQRAQEQPETSNMFYHGTATNLKRGDLVLPPSKTGKVSEKGRKKNLDVVFLTKDPRSALIYAGRAVNSLGGGIAAVYVVEPQGPLGELNNTPGTTVFYAPYAKVLRRLKPEELKKKKKN